MERRKDETMDKETILKIHDLASDPLGIIFFVGEFGDGKYRWNGALQRRQADGSYSLYTPDNTELLRVIEEYLANPAA